mgnify:FL=1
MEATSLLTHDPQLEDVTIHAGESALKECSNIIAINCRFEGKYPFLAYQRIHCEKLSLYRGSPCCSMVLSKSANGRYLGRSTEDVP